MSETASPRARPVAAERIIDAVTGAIAATTGRALVGFYLCGSLATGDFDERASDIDLLAVLSTDVSPDLAAHLERLHEELAEDNPTWRGRIEVVYVSAVGLTNFREASPRIAVISPGEPFHVISAGTDRILTWYSARHNGIVLVGPPATDVVPDISFDEYGDAVRNQMRQFSERIADDATPGSQAYAVLTMCRGLYTCVHGEQVSKLRAATWAQKEFPEWAGLIREAITWREHQWEVPQADGTATASTVRRFVAEIAKLAARPA
jgi:predicted nucleotidyltransferase